MSPSREDPNLPSGTVTLLFTDVQGSVPLWERYPQAMPAAQERHNAILRGHAEANGGVVYRIIGDGFQIVFQSPLGAVKTAIAAQRDFFSEDWGEIGSMRVRMGLHTGPTQLHGGEYITGLTFFRASHVMSAGHGGQILTSSATAEMIRDQLPDDVDLKDLGQHHFKGLSHPERVFQVIVPGLPQDFPPLASGKDQRHNLPVEVSTFVGREDEISAVIRLLENPQSRLVTILGPGGIGKSRLANQIARRMLAAFPDGVWLVPLASLSSPDFITSAIGSVLNVSFSNQISYLDQLSNYLRRKQMLLVLDNFEHLLPEGADLPLRLLQQTAQLKILVSSRERLNLLGEWVYEIHGLPYPRPDDLLNSAGPADLASYDAVQLFVHRARQVDSSYAFSPRDLPHIVRICQLVEGLPLGIELAAPWVRFMSPQEIAQEIERNLDFLATSMRSVPDRHQSLRAIFEQTWGQLSKSEREGLQRLSIFAGGWTREAAEEVAGASLAVLASLANKALIRHDNGERYEMHNLVRVFALKQLQLAAGEYERLHIRHTGYYTAFLQKRTRDLKEDRQKEALQEISTEIDNIRSAWQWAVDRGDFAAFDRAAECLWLYYENRGALREGEIIFKQAVDSLERPGQISGQPETVTGFLLAAQGWLAARRGEVEYGRQLMERGLARIRQAGDTDRQKEATILIWLGSLTMVQGKFGEVLEMMAKCLALCTQLNYQWGMASSQRLLGTAAQFGGQFAQAEKYLQKSIRIYEQIGHQRMQAKAVMSLGVIAIWLGEYNRANKLLAQAVQTSREHNDLISLTDELRELGRLHLTLGEYSRAVEILQETLALYDTIGRLDRGAALSYLGLTLCHMDEHEQAERLFEQSLAASREVGHLPDIAAGVKGLGIIAYARKAYDHAREKLLESLEIWGQIGHEPEIASVYRYLGHTTAAMGASEHTQARDYYHQALHLAQQHQLAPIAMDVLVGLARLSIAGQDLTGAMELLSTAATQPASSHQTRSDAQKLLAEFHSVSPAPHVQEAKSPAQSWDWQTLASEILATPLA